MNSEKYKTLFNVLAKISKEMKQDGTYIVFCPKCTNILKYKDNGFECINHHQYSKIISPTQLAKEIAETQPLDPSVGKAYADIIKWFEDKENKGI